MLRPVIAAVILVAACSGGGGPTLVDDMPADLRELVEDTFSLLAEALPAHLPCLDSLVVDYAWELDHRAEYRPAIATVVLRVPAPATHLSFSLVHEVAHHLESACPAQEEMRPGFLAAQGHPPDRLWFSGPSWEETPSEQFATALARYVTGETGPHRVAVTEAALGVVADWARGVVNHGSSAP